MRVWIYGLCMRLRARARACVCVCVLYMSLKQSCIAHSPQSIPRKKHLSIHPGISNMNTSSIIVHMMYVVIGLRSEAFAYRVHGVDLVD